jgi:SIR2-like domain
LSHDPQVQADYIRQSLSHDKRPIGVFIGAGCPASILVDRAGVKEPLIPGIAGMTSRINAALVASPQKNVYELVLSHLVGDGIGSPNIEEILSHVRFLRQVAGKDKARGVSAADADKLDVAICEELARLANTALPSPDTPFHQLAAWAGSINRAFPVEFFTTNYDLLLEEALEANRVPFFDGFVGSKSSFLDLQAMEGDASPPRWARLWNIHGSLNWNEDTKGGIHRGIGVGSNRRLI